MSTPPSGTGPGDLPGPDPSRPPSTPPYQPPAGPYQGVPPRQGPAAPGPGRPTGIDVNPLLPDDPPRIGGYWLDSRVHSSPSGVAFAAHSADNKPAIVILLSRGAAADAAARDRLAGLVNPMHIDHVLARGGQGQDIGRMARKFVDQSDLPDLGDDTPPAPWVALAWDGGQAGAEEAADILSAVQLTDVGPLGSPAGPDYRLYWIDRVKPGLAGLWPLPWPGRYDRAGWVTILVSWLLMLLLAALAVLIAILSFHNQAPESPPNQTSPSPQSGSPSPQSGSPSPQSGSPSPQSGSPSPQSGSPSPQSGSPSPQSGSPSSQSGSPASPSRTPSMSGSPSGSPSPSGTASGGGSSVPSDSGSPGSGDSPRSRL
ncbi:MAG: hypothetical protein ACR2I1_00760 [Propionibacteriaceae bacterium]